MYRFLFNQIKKKIPKISDTELIALRSGNTSIDRSILMGKIHYPKKHKIENKFSKKKLDSLLNSWNSNEKIYPNTNKNRWIKYLGENKYFSFLIDEKYNGIKLSVNELSNMLTKVASVDPALGVAVMVPNSLGPGELLSHYGTESQKNKYLNGLAVGKYIPCFGLTGPENGSDATGSIDEGIAVEKGGEILIKINLNKRYITLAPVANLMGIAFNLKDPNNLIGKDGVTLALVERSHSGLIQDTYHNPLNIGFPNGTIKGEIFIKPNQVIGGIDNIGNGWKMLMDCLSAGRGVSLPATANASSKVASVGILNYMKIRKQFNISLNNMEAIQEKFNKIILNTWLIQSSIDMTNDILDEGNSPSVISAIMKQQTTERGRMVINEAMDIHAGASICVGYNNFLEKYYKAIPVGITVEGSNTLTRSLIIFGQGLNKSHPYIFDILQSILNNDEKAFKVYFNKILFLASKLYINTFNCFNGPLEKQINNFACLTNFVALKGGKIKGEQMISGAMADVFSNLYLAISVRYYQEHYKASEELTNYIIDNLVNENNIKINEIINNLGPERFLLQQLKKKPIYKNYNNEKKIFNHILKNKKIIEEIEKNIHISGVIKDMKEIELYNYDTQEYDMLKNKIINVDEYKNE